jgi:hypothetical protein
MSFFPLYLKLHKKTHLSFSWIKIYFLEHDIFKLDISMYEIHAMQKYNSFDQLSCNTLEICAQQFRNVRGQLFINDTVEVRFHERHNNAILLIIEAFK